MAGRTAGQKEIFAVTTISGELLSPARVRANILNALKRNGKRAKKLLNMTTEHWNDKPIFKDELHYAGGDIALVAYPYGTSNAVRHWHMVNDGTRFRYVEFSKDYQPKTMWDPSTGRGSLGTNIPGQGRKWLDRSRRKPGIRPRKWADIIYEVMEGDFANDIQEAIRKGLE